MKQFVLLLLPFLSVSGAPASILPPSSCKDATAVFVAGEAINKINQDRTTGYVFSLERVSNVHYTQHGETGVVFYLTIDILETKCHVLSKKSYKECEPRDFGDNPVYGQCKAVMYVNKPHRVSRLYKYSCTIRPVSPSKIHNLCPDCPTLISSDDKEVEKTMKMGLEKFNKESGLQNYFALLNITRAIFDLGMLRMYSVEFTIQETICSNKTDVSEVSTCDLMTCEFAHKGFCKTTHTVSNGEEFLKSNCEIYEPQAATEEKTNHMQAAEMDHDHKNTHAASHSHDHTYEHTSPHSHPDTHDHQHAADHKHEHDHGHGEDHGHPHAHEHNKSQGHDHSHEHSHDHDHAHHDQAHNHTQDKGVHPSHHNYGHAEGQTHEHDHELALDHEHKHGHLHEYEHHHHHHHHAHETTVRRPEGSVQVLPSLDKPMTLPSFPDQDEKPSKPVGFPLHPDPQIPGEMEPIIDKFPNTLSINCPAEFQTNDNLIQNAFAEDPVFKFIPAA